MGGSGEITVLDPIEKEIGNRTINLSGSSTPLQLLPYVQLCSSDFPDLNGLTAPIQPDGSWLFANLTIEGTLARGVVTISAVDTDGNNGPGVDYLIVLS